ncbi:hypothetical protein LVD15_23330 [Fulvivirga maritima]|uniref:hypothetical protein n=1 Tax=Fulvivirga maritima TaxID=2904247 RepID=UPI001F2A254B|nr:hypothetical protein [Fulvivirga maritima]UII26202.1 hypothetical protein LVD15_23330 [Fulvivirga maritima]
MKNQILPDYCVLSQKKSFKGVLDEVTIYSVSLPDSIINVKLDGYPKNSDDMNTLKWINLNELSDENKVRLIKEIQDANQTKNDIYVSQLISALHNSDSIFFAGYYDVRKSVTYSYNFYYYKFFFDLSEQKLYLFDYVEGS